MVAAALWILCVRWDKIEEAKRPKTRSGLRDASFPSQNLLSLTSLEWDLAS